MSSSSSSASASASNESDRIERFMSDKKFYDAGREFLQRFKESPLRIEGDRSGTLVGEEVLGDLCRAISCCALETKPFHSNNLRNFWIQVSTLMEPYKTEISQIPAFELHPFIVDAFAKNKIIKATNNSWRRVRGPPQVHLSEVIQSIEQSLKTDPADVRTALIVHSIQAISKYYENIYLDELAALLDISPKEAEKALSKLIMNKMINASIDKMVPSAGATGGFSCLIEFSGAKSDNFNDSLFRLCQEVTICSEIASKK